MNARHARDPRIDEGYRTATLLGRLLLILAVLVALGIATVTWAATSHAAGSDSPTPYTVTAAGITLPTGRTFQDNGHVNVRWSTGTGSVHFEGKCVTRTDAECAGKRHDDAQFIGTAFIPWSAFGQPDCVTWVQISDFNEHFGEGGQPPVCLTTEEPTPCPTEATPTPSVTPSSPPSPTSAPTPTPSSTGPSTEPSPTSTSSTPSPSPTSPSPTITPSASPPAPVVTSPPTTSPSTPVPSATSTLSPEPTRTPAVLATQPQSATPTGPGSERPPVPSPLASTGTDAHTAVLLTLALLAVGAVLYFAAARKRGGQR